MVVERTEPKVWMSALDLGVVGSPGVCEARLHSCKEEVMPEYRNQQNRSLTSLRIYPGEMFSKEQKADIY